MANWNLPTTASAYTTVLSELDGRLDDLALMFDGLSPTNLPTGAFRIDGTSSNTLQTWNGATWDNEELTLKNLTILTTAPATETAIQLTGTSNIASTETMNFFIDSDNSGTLDTFNWYANSNDTTGALLLMTLTEAGILAVDQIAVGFNGSGNSVLGFYDDNSDLYRVISWNDTNNQFEMESNTATFHKILGAGDLITWTGTSADALELTSATLTSGSLIGATISAGTGIAIEANITGGTGVGMKSTAASAGSYGLDIYSDVATRTVPVARIINDNATGTGAALQIQSDQGPAIELIGKGHIKFPATQISSTDANTLDDYEEGSWTPHIWDNSDNSNELQTYSNQFGTYVKIGKLVFISGTIVNTSLGNLTAGDPVHIGPLPFTSSNNTDGQHTIGFNFCDSLTLSLSGGVVNGYILNNSDRIDLEFWDSTNGPTQLLISELGGIFPRFNFSGCYLAAT